MCPRFLQGLSAVHLDIEGMPKIVEWEWFNWAKICRNQSV